MRHSSAPLGCIVVLALGCGDDTTPINEGSSSSASSTSSDPSSSGAIDSSDDATTGPDGTTDEPAPTTDSTSSSSTGPMFVCGDGVVEGDELCDTDELADQTCASQGFDGGELACSTRCDEFDTRGCWTAVCGNTMAEGDELCDRGDLGGASCTSEGFDSGALACNPDCATFDTSECGTCGNVIVDGDEVCDDIVLLGQTCTSQGFDSGDLGCSADCLSYDASGCGTCGNDLVDGAESCDGLNLDGQTCLTQGFDSGNLGCVPGCLDFDMSGCGACGNGAVDGAELCDGPLTGGQTCVAQGFDNGTLGCDPGCMAFDTSTCGICGNAIVDGSEDCDGLNLDGQTCVTLGGTGGVLACAPDCQFDASACEQLPAPTLLITQGATLQERELDGNLLSSTMVPLAGGAENELRELTHFSGITYVYRGTFAPTMTYYDVGIADWVHESFPGWSTVNNVSYGGMTYAAGWVWATDMNTAGASEVGLVRFSLLGLPTERVMDTQAYIDVFAGHDGLVYGLRSNQSTVDVLEPTTGTLLSTVPLATSVRAVAVAADGTILGASWDSTLYQFDAMGNQSASLGPGISSLVDVDLAIDGTIAVGGRFGEVAIIQPDLSGIVGSFDAGGDETFLEFLEPF